MVRIARGGRGMTNFFAELKRRHIFRVAATYAVVAWVLLQVVNNVAPALRIPDWGISLVLLLLVVGFPVALLFAWIHQLAPDDGALANVTTGKLDWALIAALVIVIGIFGYQQFASLAGAPIATQQQAGVDAARKAAASPAGAVSIAVLPFTNLSDDREQEFFSDGMTEEITSALAKIPDLRVVGRTSAFQFKGQNQDLRAIGQALSATHLLEGSVRKEGNRLRITAQLIVADNGVHVWTESYNRELTGVFAVQEEIAGSIAGALRVPLGLRQGETLVSNRTSDVESYQQFLRAKALVRARGIKPLTDAAVLLEQVVVRDSDYAPAWALLAQAYGLTPNYHPAWESGSVDELRRIADASSQKAEAAARRAIQLDANLADGYFSLARLQAQHGKFLLAEDLYSKALMLDPGNPDALHLYSFMYARVGRFKEALVMRQRLQALEPFVPVFNRNTALVVWVNGQTDAAIAMLNDLPRDAPDRALFLARIYAAAGRYGEAADVLREIPPGTYTPETVDAAVRLLRGAPATASSAQDLPRLEGLHFVYLHVGASGRALDFYEGNVEGGYGLPATELWHASYAPVRKTERFKSFARKAGFVDYWRERGWPDLCRPVGTDDFVCD